MKINSIVKLKGIKGPDMLVASFVKEDGVLIKQGYVRCTWFDTDNRQSWDTFSPEALTEVS